MRRYKAALIERNVQIEGHRGFTTTLSKDTVVKWEEMCQWWDNTPYPKAGIVESSFFVKTDGGLPIFLACALLISLRISPRSLGD